MSKIMTDQEIKDLKIKEKLKIALDLERNKENYRARDIILRGLSEYLSDPTLVEFEIPNHNEDDMYLELNIDNADINYNIIKTNKIEELLISTLCHRDKICGLNDCTRVVVFATNNGHRNVTFTIELHFKR